MTEEMWRTELVSRESNGISVKLFWSRATNLVTVAVAEVAHAFEDAAPLSKPKRGVGSSVSNVIEFPVRRKYDGQLESDIVLPLATDDEVASAIIRLARRNEALEDFAALVAHELKTPLQAALLADNPSRHLEDALDLVDALLEAAQNERDEREFTPVAECLDQALADLRT